MTLVNITRFSRWIFTKLEGIPHPTGAVCDSILYGHIADYSLQQPFCAVTAYPFPVRRSVYPSI